MIDLLFNNFNILASGCGPFNEAEFKLISSVYHFFFYSTPAVVIALCTVDIAKAAISQDDNAMKKAQGNALKRLIAGVIVFFIPVLLNLILGMNYATYDENGKQIGKVDLGQKECISKAGQ